MPFSCRFHPYATLYAIQKHLLDYSFSNSISVSPLSICELSICEHNQDLGLILTTCCLSFLNPSRYHAEPKPVVPVWCIMHDSEILAAHSSLFSLIPFQSHYARAT